MGIFHFFSCFCFVCFYCARANWTNQSVGSWKKLLKRENERRLDGCEERFFLLLYVLNLKEIGTANY